MTKIEELREPLAASKRVYLSIPGDPAWPAERDEKARIARQLHEAAVAVLPSLLGQLDTMREALFPSAEADASLNLQGALCDLRGSFDPGDGGVIAGTVERVIDQIERARAALSTPLSEGEGK